MRGTQRTKADYSCRNTVLHQDGPVGIVCKVPTPLLLRSHHLARSSYNLPTLALGMLHSSIIMESMVILVKVMPSASSLMRFNSYILEICTSNP